MGAYLDSPKIDKDTSKITITKHFSYVATSMQGWRLSMEDSHITYSDEQNQLYIFGVFDGHGGKEVARFSQNHFLEQLFSTPGFKEKNFPLALTQTFYNLDELLLSPDSQDELKLLKYDADDEKNDEEDEEDLSSAGSTANIVLISGRDLYVANVGDSRSALCEKGTFIQLSEDHKPDLEKEKDRILKSGSSVVNGRVGGDLSVSRALGDFEFKANRDIGKDEQSVISKPDITHRVLTENSEFILVGCDGIWETNKTEVIMKMIQGLFEQKKYSLKAIIEYLLDQLISKDSSERYGMDNMTAILIKIHRPEEEIIEDGLLDDVEKKEIKKSKNTEEKLKKEQEFRDKMDRSLASKIDNLKTKKEEQDTKL